MTLQEWAAVASIASVAVTWAKLLPRLFWRPAPVLDLTGMDDADDEPMGWRVNYHRGQRPTPRRM